MKLLFSVLLFLISNSAIFAQYEKMLHKSYLEKVTDIDILYRNTINNSAKDSKYIKSYTQKMKKWALVNNDEELVLESELLSAYGCLFIATKKNPKYVENLILVAEKGKKSNIKHIEARAVHVIADHYWKKENYEKAFEWLLKSSKVLDTMDPDSFPNIAAHLNFIGRCYYYFRDYEKAITYYKKSSELTKTDFNNKAVTEGLNTLGLSYQKLGDLTRSSQSFLKIINDTTAYKNIIWEGIASGNLGYNYYMEGEYSKAIPLFETDISIAMTRKDYGLAAGSAVPLADVYLKQHQYKKAKQKIDEATKYIQFSGQTDRLRKLYPIISKWHAANNNSNLSITYLDSAMIANEEYNKKYNSLIVLRANQKVEAKERKIEIEKLKTESQQKITQRNIVITSIVILLIASIFGFLIRNKYLLKKQQVKELALEKSQKALLNAKEQLEHLTLKVRKDNKLIEELTKIKPTEINPKILEELKTKNILTQKDWLQYQNMFTKVHPYFIPSLMGYYPDLSQAEIRCLCLEQLSLNNNEMSLILGVSINTMRVTKHRIRKKLNIKSQEEMENLLEELVAKLKNKSNILLKPN